MGQWDGKFGRENICVPIIDTYIYEAAFILTCYGLRNREDTRNWKRKH